MATNWFYQIEGKEHGPISSAELKRLAESRVLRTSDLVRKDQMNGWVSASKIKGLFSNLGISTAFPKTGEKPSPEAASSAKENVSPNSSAEQHSSDAKEQQVGVSSPSLGSRLKSAGELSIKQAERVRLTNIVLPSAYRQLGRHIFAQKAFAEDFSENYQDLNKLVADKEAISEGAEARPVANSFADKAREVALATKDAAQTKMLELRISQATARLGEAAYERHGETSGPTELVQPITSALASVRQIAREIEALSASRGGQWISQGRIKWVAVTVVCIIGVTGVARLILSRKPATAGHNSAVDVTWSNPQKSGSSQLGDNSTPSDPMQSSDAPTELPRDFTDLPKWPDAPFLKIQDEFKELGNGKDGIKAMSFSPHGRFAIGVFGPKLRVWRIATGVEVVASATDCNYFSNPVQFSPDESKIASVDGETLRIWDITNDTASQIQSLPLPDEDNPVWTSVAWQNDGQIALSSRSLESQKLTFLSLSKGDGGQFSVRGSPISIDIRATDYRDAMLSPTGDALALFNSPGAFNSQPFVELRDVSRGTAIKVSTPNSDNRRRNGRRDTDSSYEFSQSFQQPGEFPSFFKFSPEGGEVLTYCNSKTGVTLKTWKPNSEKCASTIDVEDVKAGGKSPLKNFTYSPDGRLLAVLLLKSQRTGEGQQVKKSLLVCDLSGGTTLRQFPIAPFPSDLAGSMDKDTFDDYGTPLIQFSADSKNIIVGSVAHKFEAVGNRLIGVRWTVTSWNIDSGETEKRIFAHIQESGPVEMNLSQDGQFLTINPTHGGLINLWETTHLAKIENDFDQGDQLWNSGNHRDAFTHYCAVLGDKFVGSLSDDIPISRLASRCVDVYAEKGDTANGNMLLAFALSHSTAIAPETDAGKKFVNDFIEAQRKKQQEEADRQSKADSAQLAEIRAKNQANRVVVSTISKREFLDRMQQMSANRVFHNYSFRDTFGDTNGDQEWTNGDRLWEYKCSDGMVQLTVTDLGNTVVVSGVNQF